VEPDLIPHFAPVSVRREQLDPGQASPSLRRNLGFDDSVLSLSSSAHSGVVRSPQCAGASRRVRASSNWLGRPGPIVDADGKRVTAGLAADQHSTPARGSTPCQGIGGTWGPGCFLSSTDEGAGPVVAAAGPGGRGYWTSGVLGWSRACWIRRRRAGWMGRVGRSSGCIQATWRASSGAGVRVPPVGRACRQTFTG
jgi:hypothetical protein